MIEPLWFVMVIGSVFFAPVLALVWVRGIKKERAKQNENVRPNSNHRP